MLINTSTSSISTLSKSKAEWVDTHSHLNFNAYKDDVDKVIKRSLENNIWMINVGSQYKTSKRAVELAEKYGNGVFAAIGFHPIHLGNSFFKVKMDADETSAENNKEKEFNVEDYKKLADSPKVVAIGEIGLDYYYRPKTKIRLEQFKEKQKEVFMKQLELARELGLPIIFHCRMAHEEMIEILKSQISNYRLKGVIHCFTGTWGQAEKYMDMGFYIGLNGIIFKLNLDDVIKKIPLDKILIETDCPYLVPPQAGAERNEPIFVKYVAERIAEIKNISINEVAETTTSNAKKLFSL